MQIAESTYPRSSQQQQQSPPPAPSQFSLVQPLSPLMEPSSEQMHYDPFLNQYPKVHLDQPSPSHMHSSPRLPSQMSVQQHYPYQTCELPGGASPEPEYVSHHPYSLGPAQQSSVAMADDQRSSASDTLGLPELPGLFDCEMMETVDPQHGGYVLVN